MSVDLRCGHDRKLRELAADMFAEGRGSVAKVLGIPEEAVRKWQQTYRSLGRDGLLNMGKTHARYGFETKVAAASAVVDGGMAKGRGDGALRDSEPLAAEAVVSPPPRGRGRGAQAQAEGQAEGVGRRGSADDPRAGARARGQAARGRGSVPKKSMALKAELRSRTGRRP